MREELLSPQRGVAPQILLDQIRVTAPFVFAEDFHTYKNAPYLKTIREIDQATELSHVEYYRLCVSAHHTSVATFVPTDVDNQIRFKLWSPSLPTEMLSQMADVVLESASWDPTPVSARIAKSKHEGEIISGHNGEWFSTAAGAYGALRKKSPEKAAEIGGAIQRELQREADIFLELKDARDGIELLKASTLIAHNLGDLDRVIEMWNLPVDDALRVQAFKLGHEKNGQFKNALFMAGQLNKLFMADENHRHFALRIPKALRRSQDFLLPVGPFFDDWGAVIAKHPLLNAKDIGEIVEALVSGWDKMQIPNELTKRTPVGYARALSGLIENYRGGFSAVSNLVPARVERILKAGPLRQQMSVAKRRFDEQWAAMAISSAKQL